MRYRTREYLIDSFWLLDFVITKWDYFRPKLRKFSDNILEFNYEEYIIRIVENLPYAFFIVFLGIFAVLTLFKYVEKPSGLRVTAITTNSMYPEIVPGSIILTSPKSSYIKNDVITYKEVHGSTGLETGRTITHRIIEVKNNDPISFITKGDSNEFPDPGEIKKTEVLGEVFMIIPYLGYFDVMVRTIPGFFIFILTPAFLLIRNEIKFLQEEKLFVKS